MLIIKENNRIYMIESTYFYSEYARQDQALVEENMPVFKACKSKVLIGGRSLPALEAIRYLHLPFSSELSENALVSKVVPRMRDVWEELGRLDEDGEIWEIAFADKDKVFVTSSNGAIREIAKEEAIGLQDDHLRYALAVTQELPFAERIQEIYKIVGRIMEINLFPIIVMDSVTFKLQIIEEKK